MSNENEKKERYFWYKASKKSMTTPIGRKRSLQNKSASVLRILFGPIFQIYFITK
jgi:hypothetical protein